MKVKQITDTSISGAIIQLTIGEIGQINDLTAQLKEGFKKFKESKIKAWEEAIAKEKAKECPAEPIIDTKYEEDRLKEAKEMSMSTVDEYDFKSILNKSKIDLKSLAYFILKIQSSLPELPQSEDLFSPLQ